MSLPAGWPEPTDVETLPTVYLQLPDAAWPPASGGRPAGLVPVAEWSVERELVGSVLPGNVRARSGLSIGSASATIAQTQDTLAPWAVQPARKVTTGGAADLYATHNGHDDAARIDFGDWIVAPASGSILNPGVTVELVERQYEGRTQPHLLPMPDLVGPSGHTRDPIWIVDRLARQLGYYATPPTVPSAVVSLPLTGTGQMEFPVVPGASAAIVPAWGLATGTVGIQTRVLPAPLPVAHWAVTGGYGDVFPDVMADNGVSRFLTLNVAGSVRVTLSTDGGPAVEFRPGGVLAVTNGYFEDVPYTTGTYEPGLHPDYPTRVQVEVQRTGTTDVEGTVTNWTSFRARARSSPTAPWSAWVESASTVAAFPGPGIVYVNSTDDSAAASGLQLSRADDAGLWAVSAKKVDLVPLGGGLGASPGRQDAPYLAPGTDAWTGIQETCAAWLAAAIVSRDKRLTILDRSRLAGTGAGLQTLDVGLAVEDLGWTIDPADAADRLEVSYTPPSWESVVQDQLAPVLWQAEDVIEVPESSTLTVKAVIDGKVGTVYSQFRPAWATGPQQWLFNTWAAFDNREASGSPVSVTSMGFAVRAISSSVVEVDITNHTGQRLYLLDANKAPCLILRAPWVGSFDTPQVVARGASVDDAVNPLSIDLGPQVQRADDAGAIADYIWGRVSTPMWKASSVRVRLDWTRDLGDVVTLTHERTGLDVKALVTKVGYDGSPGEVAQTLDLVLLPPTWADFDTAWAGQTWTAFDTAWAGRTWDDFDADPLRTGA